MTQEKELLLKDLCAKLPHGIVCKDQYGEYIDVIIYNAHIEHLIDQILSGIVQMVLRPMSSMTEEEEDLLSEFNCYYINGELFFSCGHSQEDIYNAIDWLNAHHFDYRGLIEKGLALEAPKEMYK